MNCYCVFGNPISRSKSPLIHRLFAEQTGEALVYDAQLTPLGDFPRFARYFFGQDKGANVTVPFEEEAYRLMDELSERATRAGAVNTLARLADGCLRGNNTNGTGLLRDLTASAGIELCDKRVLLLGVSGTVRGVLESFLGEYPMELLIANRTARKAVDLAEWFADLGAVHGYGFAEVEGPFDLVVNGTSASLAGDVPPLAQSVIESGRTVCYDMMYIKEPTAFNHWTTERDATYTLDGLGMLVKQVTEAFFL